MEQYSRQFIEELAKHIDPAIADFFNMKHEIFKFPAKTFTELIDETLMDYLEGKTSREDLFLSSTRLKNHVCKNVPDGTSHTLMMLTQ